MLRRVGRTGTPADLLVVGLGNPGEEYARTRHNVGAEVVEILAKRHDVRLRKGKERSLVGEARVDGKRLVLAVPLTWMNESGNAVGVLARRFGIVLERLVVVHDELDLPLGALRVKERGGLAGHNGLRSIKAHLHSDAFLRIRIGIGKPPSKERGTDHVLDRFSKRERQEIDIVLQEAADAAELILAEGIDAAMNRYNLQRP